MDNIVVGTVIIWILTKTVVNPGARLLLNRRMKQEGVTLPPSNHLSANEINKWLSLRTKYYQIWSVAVLGIAGLVIGLSGHLVVGISSKKKDRAGMLAFILGGLIGLMLK